jgi:glutamine amidotransferase
VAPLGETNDEGNCLMIGIIDYGLSNIRSVLKAFDYLEVPTRLVTKPEELGGFEMLVLPGVGAFAGGMAGLRRLNLVGAIHEAIGKGTPFLGICVGMQLLFEWGEEDGLHEGLGVLGGRVMRFPEGELVVPHMGWNQLEIVGTSGLVAGISPADYAYFVHSYHCQPTDPTLTIAYTDYGVKASAIVGRDNVYGLQFHPEKSQEVGLNILKNFSEI